MPRPFDWRLRLCDNPRAVIKPLSLLVVLMLLATACGKTSDLGPMQDEANGIATTYKPKFDALSKRVAALEQRGRTLTSDAPGLNDARKLFVETNAKLVELRSAVTQAPAAITTAAKAEQPRAELIRVMGELRTRLQAGHTEVNANLDAVESWIAQSEWRPRTATPPAPPPAPIPEPGIPETPPGTGSAGPS